MALNGAQVSSLLQVIDEVNIGKIPRDSATQIIMTAFNLDRQTVDRIFGRIGKGFKPSGQTERSEGNQA